MSIQNSPFTSAFSILLMKGSKGRPPPLISILILCLIFFCVGHDLKFCYLLSLFTCAIVCLLHKTACFMWWDLVLFSTVSHCLDHRETHGRCSIHEGGCPQSWHCSHVSSLQGEICLCTSRIFVQKSIYSEFLKKFVEATRMWKVGIPSDPLASMGALISKAHLEKVSKSLQSKL